MNKNNVFVLWKCAEKIFEEKKLKIFKNFLFLKLF